MPLFGCRACQHVIHCLYLLGLKEEAKLIVELLLLHKEAVGLLLCLLQKTIEQGLQICWGHIVRQVKLRSYMKL